MQKQYEPMSEKQNKGTSARQCPPTREGLAGTLQEMETFPHGLGGGCFTNNLAAPHHVIKIMKISWGVRDGREEDSGQICQC